MEHYILQPKDDYLGMLIEVQPEENNLNFVISEIEQEGEEEIDVWKVCSGKITWDGSFNAHYGENGHVQLFDVNGVIAMSQAFEFLWKKAADHFSDVEDFDQWEAGKANIRVYGGNIKVGS